MRRFHQLILSVVSSGEGGDDDGVAACGSSLDPSCGSCSRFASMFIVHPCRSKQEAAAFFSSITAPRLLSCSVLSKPPPVLYLVSSIVPSCVSPPVSFSCRLAYRPVLISFRLARCAERLASRLAVAPFCSARLAILLMLFRPLVAS